jgi:hypothetical protein
MIDFVVKHFKMLQMFWQALPHITHAVIVFASIGGQKDLVRQAF